MIQVADLTGHEDDAAVLVVRYDGPPGTTRPVGGA